MSFDNSRITFDPWRDYFGVVMQQGRVQLDSDWNEWVAEIGRRLQAGTLDILGLAGVPSTTPDAFKIGLAFDSQATPVLQMTVGNGRIYVDGILVENHGPVDSPQWDPALAELSGSPQPPGPGQGSIDYAQAPWPPTGNGPFVIYLDVWQREVTWLEDPNLVEKAIGVDSTGRYQTVWQVKWLNVSNVPGVACSTPVDAWTSLIAPSGSRLTTGIANVPFSSSGPCSLSPGAGYSGLENQLYRVAIHRSGSSSPSPASLPPSPDTATFKWSRNNASIATVITGIATVNSTIQLTVQSLGRDQVLGFNPGDWIELSSGASELDGAPGVLAQIDTIDATARTITLVPNTAFSAGQPTPTRVARWDQAGAVYLGDGVTLYADLNAPGSTGEIPVPPPGTTLILEDGVTVSFTSAADSFGAGDFWTFAARTADGSVEALNQAPPRGVHHHYCRLAIADLSTSKPTVSDCRPIFQTLANPAIHVCKVLLQGVSIANNGMASFQQLGAGITVVCDLPLDPAILPQPPTSPDSPVFRVTVDVPSAFGFSPTVLPAKTIAISPSNTITWTPDPNAITALQGQLKQLPPGPPLLVRFTLKGNAVWALGNPNIFLNGATVSQQGFDLRFPTGDGRPSADFEMCFWLASQPLVTLSPASITFPAQTLLTTSSPVALTIANSGPPVTLDPGSVTITGPASPDFALVGSFTTPLGTEATSSVDVTFQPSSRGARSAQINIQESADTDPLVVQLLGVCTGPLMDASPASLAFSASQPVGVATAPQAVTLRNDGNVPLTITDIVLEPPTDFTFTPASFPLGVDVGQSTTVQVQFQPSSAGVKSAVLEVSHNDPTTTNPLPIDLSGTGSPGTPAVTIAPANLVLNFPSLPTDGGSVAASILLTSSGTVPLTVRTVSIGGSLAKHALLGPVDPVQGTPLTPNETCTINVSTSGVPKSQVQGGEGLPSVQMTITFDSLATVAITIHIPVINTTTGS